MKARLLRIYASMRMTVYFMNASVIAYCLTAMIGLNNWSFSQCIPQTPSPDCSSIVAPTLTEGTVVGAGQTYVVPSSISLTTITMDGGELIVCGGATLTINTITFNSGTLSVAAGGTLNIITAGTAMVMGANSTIMNYGTINMANSIVIGNNCLVANVSSTSIFMTPFNQIVVQGTNAQFVNNGQVQSSFIVNSSNTTVPWCLGPGSQTVTGILINQYNFGFAVPSGSACLNVTNFMSNSQPLTDTPNLVFCYNASTVTVSGSPNFGNATVMANQPSCIVLLGYMYDNLNGQVYQGNVHLNWTIEKQHTELERIEVFRYDNLLGDFKEIGTLTAGIDSSNSVNNYVDHQAFQGQALFYKLKFITTDGRVESSEVVKVESGLQSGTVFYPNPFHDVLYCTPGVEVKEVYTLDAKACSFIQEKERITFGYIPADGLIIIYEIKGNTMMERVLTN